MMAGRRWTPSEAFADWDEADRQRFFELARTTILEYSRGVLPSVDEGNDPALSALKRACIECKVPRISFIADAVMGAVFNRWIRKSTGVYCHPLVIVQSARDEDRTHLGEALMGIVEHRAKHGHLDFMGGFQSPPH